MIAADLFKFIIKQHKSIGTKAEFGAGKKYLWELHVKPRPDDLKKPVKSEEFLVMSEHTNKSNKFLSIAGITSFDWNKNYSYKSTRQNWKILFSKYFVILHSRVIYKIIYIRTNKTEGNMTQMLFVCDVLDMINGFGMSFC